MYDGANTLSGRARVRYDKLLNDHKEHLSSYINSKIYARQLDAEDAHRERSWQRQLQVDQDARDRLAESIKQREERERKEREKEEEANRRWQETFNENKRRSDRSHDLQVKRHNDNVAMRREAAAATRARGVRGKQLGFSDGNGNQVAIYENVWKGSMQQVYDVMLEDLAPTDETERRKWERQMKKLDTAQKKEDYVKQNWHKSAKASAIMLALSKLDPASMTSELNEEDYSEYEQEGEEDYSQYEV